MMPTICPFLDTFGIVKAAQARGDLQVLVDRNRRALRLTRPRAVWLMVPAATVDGTLAELDGGNSYYIDDLRRHQELAAKGIHYIDVGTSGGVWGLDRGYCLMIGGPNPAVERLDPVFRTLAPGRDSAPTTPRRKQRDGTAEEGYLHCGPAGAGHFVKMVHNGSSTDSWQPTPRVLTS